MFYKTYLAIFRVHKVIPCSSFCNICYLKTIFLVCSFFREGDINLSDFQITFWFPILKTNLE